MTTPQEYVLLWEPGGNAIDVQRQEAERIKEHTLASNVFFGLMLALFGLVVAGAWRL